ncbi:GspE/PulE family protein [Aquifex aeolicus]|uniref:General secretion pathway protein E n=1 Tax=Aquifex aeolicus (strain VF5) TaxID=224324 RepID=O67452_AQUAE|nr:GspE/PulE family protein [Aquifex aeolicus]AAC07412.1 general secretion pathway protein E [Aquifex aeolicus VF5]
MSELSESFEYIVEEENERELLVIVPQNYNFFAVEELRFKKGKDVKLKVLSEEEYAKLIQDRISGENVVLEEEEEREEKSEDILFQRDTSPAVRLVNTVLIKASSVNASDVHFEPYEDEAVVRIRMDGVLHDYTKVSPSLYQEVVSRIKVMAKLNVAEKRIPQDGKIRVKIGKRDYDIRVSVVPTVFGERVVLRLLEKTGQLLTLSDLGLSKGDEEKVRRLAEKPYGIVLVTGPTGAGKSTTLYAMLLHVKNPKKNIITIEDPVEYQVKGISQIQVNPKVGLTFAQGLRAILRQDPDVIMVGEIRDPETAEVAVQAALTGHLVLSTLHTNDAPSAITRLKDLGIEPFLIASSLEGVIAQRLVRKICNNCKEPYKPSKEEIRELGLPEEDYTFYRGRGCEHCLGTGYRGRTGIFEVLEVDEDMKKLINETQDSVKIRQFARKKGYKTMLEDGIEKILKGITTSSEVLSVVK